MSINTALKRAAILNDTPDVATLPIPEGAIDSRYQHIFLELYPFSQELTETSGEITILVVTDGDDVIPGAAIATISDTFNDNTQNTTLWDDHIIGGAATVAETGNQLVVTPAASTSGSNYAGYKSDSLYNLTGGEAKVEVVQAPFVVDGFVQTIFSLEYDANNYIEWNYNGTHLHAFQTVDGVPIEIGSVVYDPDVHVWWKIREDSGIVYFDTSVDNSTWTNRFSIPNPFIVSALRVYLYAGTSFSTTFTPSTAVFDNFNITPVEYTETSGEITVLVVLDGEDTFTPFGNQHYDELTGEVTVLVTTTGTDTESMVETTGEETVLVVLSGTDSLTYNEITGEVTVLVVQTGTDTLTAFETSGSVDVLVILSGTDHFTASETAGSTQTILVTITGSDTLAATETATQVILVAQSGSDSLVANELTGQATILVVLSGVGVLSMPELTGAVTVLVPITGTDSLLYTEISGSQIILVTITGQENVSLTEISGTQVVLVVQSGVDLLIFNETTGSVVVLVVLDGEDIDIIAQIANHYITSVSLHEPYQTVTELHHSYTTTIEKPYHPYQTLIVR